jgi:hypothetical protein
MSAPATLLISRALVSQLATPKHFSPRCVWLLPIWRRGAWSLRALVTCSDTFVRSAYATNVVVMAAGFALFGYQMTGYFVA